VLFLLRADGNLMLVPLVSRGIEKDNRASVHAGFLISYNSVRATVIRTMRGQLRAFPDYAVVIAGTFYSAKPNCCTHIGLT